MSDGSIIKENGLEYRILFRSTVFESDLSEWSDEKEIGGGENEIARLKEEMLEVRESFEKSLEDKEAKVLELEERLKGIEKNDIPGNEKLEREKNNLGMQKEEVEQERRELDSMKADYEAKLSMLGEREYELNQMEAELAQKREEAKARPGEPDDNKFDINVILEKGKSMAANKQNLQAYFFFRLAVYVDPGNAVALNNLAISLYRLDFKEKAVACIKKVLALDPGNEAAKINLERMNKD